jgi:large-conductance mechanosensitive channel
MRFDLSPMKRESVRLIIDLVVAVMLGSAVFSAIVFLIVRHSLLVPLRNVTQTIDALQSEAVPVQLPEFESREMSELANAVMKACRTPRASI